MKHIYLYLVILIIVYAFILGLTYNPVWVIIIFATGTIYGSLSNVVALRKLYFLAGASPHIALLAVTLSIPTTYLLGGEAIIYAFIYSLIMIYIVGYMIYKGVDTDIAISLIVGITASLTVLAIYYVLTNYPLEYSLSAVIMGDPLLTSWSDAYLAVFLAVTTFTLIYLTRHEQLSLGIDQVSTMLSGIKILFYDLLMYTLLGLGVVGLLRITGYILEHILLLLPPSIALTCSKSADEAFTLTIIVALASSLLGLHLALILNLAPSGVIGVLLSILYIIAFIGGRK